VLGTRSALSKLPDVVSVRVVQHSSTVGETRPGLIAQRSEATRRQSSDTQVSARMPSRRNRIFSSAWHGGQNCGQLIVLIFAALKQLDARTETSSSATLRRRFAFCSGRGRVSSRSAAASSGVVWGKVISSKWSSRIRDASRPR
jgi:hypothetical protein